MKCASLHMQSAPSFCKSKAKWKFPFKNVRIVLRSRLKNPSAYTSFLFYTFKLLPFSKLNTNIGMNPDINPILKDWAFERGQISARLIQGLDGEPKIQVRLDLGLLQMETDGRPDGQRPFGYGSLLEYFEAKLDGVEVPTEEKREDSSVSGTGPKAEPTAEEDADDVGGTTEPGERAGGEIALTSEECSALRDEALQYYHRYVALWILEDFDGVVRDTSRNLRALDLCRDHAQSDQDRAVLEQFRPYILMMRARALAQQAMKDNEPKAAVLALDDGLEQLRAVFTEAGQAQLYEESSEVEVLRAMRESLMPRLPVSESAELKQRLQRAVEQENYELAAILRDELKMLQGDKGQKPGKKDGGGASGTGA